MGKMFSPSHFKTSNPHSIFSQKTSSSMKIKNIIHSRIVSSMCRIIRGLSKAKSNLVEILKDSINAPYNSHKKRRHQTNKIIMGSFRLHSYWASSRSSSNIIAVPSRVYEGTPKVVTLCGQTQSDNNSRGENFCHDSELAGYLQWLEENDDDIARDGYKRNDKDKEIIKDVDMLAEMFIANCHAKFKVEMEESCRRYQEMLARSL